MRTVDIPGGTATLRESDDLRAMDSDLMEEFFMVAAPAFAKMPEEVLEGKRDDETVEQAIARLRPLMDSVQLTREEARATLQLRRASIVASLASWTLDAPLPTTVEELGECPRSVVEALDKAIGGLGAVLQPTVDFSPPTGDMAKALREEPERPTAGSSS